MTLCVRTTDFKGDHDASSSPYPRCLCATATALSSVAFGQEAGADEPGPMPTNVPAQVAKNLRSMKDADGAFNQRDWIYLDRVHKRDMVAHVMGNPEPVRGAAALKGMLSGMLQAFPDMHVANEYPLQFGEGKWTTAMAKVSGTFTGKMVKPDGTTVQGTGKHFDLLMTTTARWENGQLAEEWVFWDDALLAQQAGLF